METKDRARFEKYAAKDSSGCVLWTGSLTKTGYGKFGLNGGWVLAHRAAWELEHGPIPTGDGYHGVCVLHRCDTPACVNPKHLFLGTHQDNMADRDRKGRGGQPGKKTKGEKNGMALLTEPQVLSILRRHKQGASQRSLAREFEVSPSLIHLIVHRKRWAHLEV